MWAFSNALHVHIFSNLCWNTLNYHWLYDNSDYVEVVDKRKCMAGSMQHMVLNYFRNGKRQFCHIWEGRKDRAQFIKNCSHGTLAYVMQKVLVMLIFFELSVVARRKKDRERKETSKGRQWRTVYVESCMSPIFIPLTFKCNKRHNDDYDDDDDDGRIFSDCVT